MLPEPARLPRSWVRSAADRVRLERHPQHCFRLLGGANQDDRGIDVARGECERARSNLNQILPHQRRVALPRLELVYALAVEADFALAW